MAITPVKELVAQAEEEIDTWSVEDAKTKLGDPNVQFVDIRDIRELSKLAPYRTPIMRPGACWSFGSTRKALMQKTFSNKKKPSCCSAVAVGGRRCRPKRYKTWASKMSRILAAVLPRGKNRVASRKLSLDD